MKNILLLPVEGLTDNQVEREKTKIKTDDKSCVSTAKNTD